ncbi:hypothetical protein ACUSIJ_17830 [Pseudochelatococcus sp. B33]
METITPYQAAIGFRVKALFAAGLNPFVDEARAVQELYAAGLGLAQFPDKIRVLDDIRRVYADLAAPREMARAA